MHSLFARYGVLAAILVVYLGFSATLIPIATDDIRLADVFSVDESGAAVEIRHYYTTGRVDRASFKYGSLFYYLPLAAISFYGVLGTVTDQVILIVLRSFGAMAGASCIVLIYGMARRLYDERAAAVACLIVATAPVFLRWSVESHPDLPQLLCVCAFMWVLIGLSERTGLRSACLAALYAGLAFNTKYVGIFLMPTLAFAILFLGHGDRLDLRISRLAEGDRWKALLAAILVFGVTIGLTNPYAIIKFDAFVNSLQAERKIMSFGHSSRAIGGMAAWAWQLVGVVGWVHAAIFLSTAVWCGMRRRLPRPVIVAFTVWCVSYVLYMALYSQLIRARHVLPVFPVLAILSGGAYALVWDQLAGMSRLSTVRHALTLVFVLGLSGSLSGAVDVASIRLDRRDSQDEIRAGRWLAEHFDAATSVLYDSYAYVPGKFQNVARTFGMTYLAIEHFRPDVLVVRDAIVSDYSDPTKASDSRIGRIAYLDSHYFYRYLKEGRLPAYRRVKSFPTLTIFARNEALEPRTAAWHQLIRMFGRGKALGVSRARMKMAEVHLTVGRHDAASEQRELAYKAQNHALNQYNNAKELLFEGKMEEARAVFDEVLTMVSTRPDSYRAAIHQHVSRTFFEAGFYSQAVAEARRAISLHDPLEEAHFELGIFLLVDGAIDASDSVFVVAVARFGQSDHARKLLGQIAENEIAPEAARRAVKTHFSR